MKYQLIEDRMWDTNNPHIAVRFTGTEDECFEWVLLNTPFSFHEATTNQGYKLIEVTN